MKIKNLNDVLMHQAIEQPDKIVFRFQKESNPEKTITYGEFLTKVQILSAKLQNITSRGDRVLLLYPPGIEFVVAFFGCLHAGVIAVPAHAPNKRNLYKLHGIISDAGIKLALCNDDTLALIAVLKLRNREHVNSLLNNIDLKHLDCKVPISDDLYGQEGRNMATDDIAFLQYTSGSTSSPKGVMVTHHNLLSNCECMSRSARLETSFHLVSWLPPFHDMGLIGKIIQTIYSGMSTTLMSPVSFVKKPIRWLNAISEGGQHYGPVISGAPNFAYDLCVSKISEDQLPDNFDLTMWQVAFSGAEPVQAKTLRRFYRKFEKYGFIYDKFFPVYGLAESTLMVTSGDVSAEPIIRQYDLERMEESGKAVEVQDPMEQQRVKDYVACGGPVFGHQVRIVNPNDFTVCSENEIGEIWVKGDSVAKGYWNNEEKTKDIFRAYTADGDGPFLRTGDMGLLVDGEIYITGRIKDMMIINGRNYYPEDIELTVVEAHKYLQKYGSAAFLAEEHGKERLIIVQELRKNFIRSYNKEEIVKAVKQHVYDRHELIVDAVVLISTSSIPKTTSGKVQRFRVREHYLNNELKIIDSWSKDALPLAV